MCSGILAELPKKQGRVLPEDVVIAVLSFDEDDEMSRICQRKKNLFLSRLMISVVHKQKRLLLVNLNELNSRNVLI